jgi:hypothetical protein
MKRMIYLLAAGAIAISPAMTLAGPGGGHGGGHGGGMGQGAAMGSTGLSGHGAGGMGHGSMNMGGNGLSRTGPTTAHTNLGSVNGKGWVHMNGPETTGQPGVECEDGEPPGNASSARGSAINEE